MKKSLLAIVFCLAFSICAFSQKTEKLDEFSNPLCEEYLARMDNLIIRAQASPDSTIYIFVYEGKEKDYKRKSLNPNRGSAKAKIKSMKKYIRDVRKVSTDNIIFAEGGFRENLTVEVWSVSNGAEPPKPTPTLTKMKYRKGKAKGFCIGCCG